MNELFTLPRESRPLARYDLLAQALLTDIREQRIKVGELLPSEAALQQRFGVSRYTVRQALRELRDKGVVVSRPGIGTIVRNEGHKSRFIHSSTSIDDLLNFSRETALKVLTSEPVVADEKLAAFLNCPSGQAWQRLTVVRLKAGDEIPLGLLTIYVRSELAGVEEFIEGAGVTVFALLEQHYGIRVAEIRQQINAVILGPEEKKIFHDSELHGLQIVRHYFDAQARLIEASVGIYPGSNFNFQSTLRASSSSGN